MDVGVLGPLTIDGAPSTSPRRDRVVLEVLVVRAGEEVRAEQLASALWDEAPPPSWAKVVQGCIVRWRKTLGSTAIETGPRGYRLLLRPGEVDATRFERLVARGRERLTLGEPDRATYLLEEALALWRGSPLDDLEDWEPGRVEARRLDELRLDAEELQLEASLRTGRHREVLGAARARVEEAPLRERRWALLALAQYQSGQQAQALRTLHEVRTLLGAELGLDPGPDLLTLEDAIHRQDPSLVVGHTFPEPRPTCPYRGLVPYDVVDAEDFHGRDEDVAACLQRLADGGVLTVIGPSGIGKSSLVRAGVAATIAREGREAVVITPGPHPVEALASLDRAGRHAVLVVDQCEEVVVLCSDPIERADFLAAVTTAADRRPVVVALRADRLGDLSVDAAFRRLVERSLYLLGPMSRDELVSAIECPAREAGLRLEAGLVDLLVRDVEGEPGALPLLSHALRATWDRREANTLTVAGYRATGGVRGAVAQSAEAVYAAVSDDQRPALRDLLLRMVAPNPEGDPVRSRLPRRLVAGTPRHERLIETLVDARLVTSDDGVVELAHEALVRAWPRLQGWLDEDSEGQRILRHLVVAADSWDAMGRPDSELYRGLRLAKAVEWRERAAPELTQSEAAFLEAGSRLAAAEERSAAEHARRQQQVNRRLRILLAGVAALGVGALLAAGIAVDRGQQAEDLRRQAVAQRNATGALALAAASRNVADTRPALAVALAAESLQESPPPLAATEALAQARLAFGENPIQPVGEPIQANVQSLAMNVDGSLMAGARGPAGVLFWEPRTGQEADLRLDARLGPTDVVAFSPHGSMLATGGPGGVRLWDLATDEPAVGPLNGFTGRVTHLAFSADGSLLAAGGPEGVSLWSAATGGVAGEPPPALGREVTALALSPEGSVLAAGGRDGVVRLWNTTNADEPVLPSIRSRELASLAFVSDRVLATSGGDTGADALRLWDVTSGRPRGALLRGQPIGAVYDIAVQPSGRLVATGGGDSTVRVIDLNEGRAVGRPLRGYADDVVSVVFSGDGTLLASRYSDGTVRVWAVDPGQAVSQQIRAGILGDGQMAFSPVGDLLVSGVRLWDIDTGQPVGKPMQHPYGDTAVAFSPDGRTLAVGGFFGPVLVWDVATGERAVPPIPQQSMVSSLAFSPDGRMLAVGNLFDGDVQLRDLSSGERLGMLHSGARVDRVTSVAFSPRTDLLAAAVSPDTIGRGSVQLWNPNTAEPVRRLLAGRKDQVTSVTFSPGGALLASGTSGGRVQLWDVASGKPVPAPMDGHTDSVQTVSFSPDGGLLASAAADGTVRLWDPSTGNPVGSPMGGRKFDVEAALFHPEGRTLAIAGTDGVIRLLDLNTDHACAVAVKYVTREQVEPYLPDGWRPRCEYLP